MNSRKHYPPVWADWLLNYFCRQDYADEILGDLHEAFYWRLKEKGPSRARRRFAWEVIKSLRPKNLKSFYHFSLNTMIFRNYIKIGIRSLIKDRKFSFINLAGLSLGLAVFLAIILLVQHELSFDKFHTKADRIYQVIQVFKNADGDDPEIWTSLKLSEAIRNDMPMVEDAVSIHAASSTWASVGGKRFFEEDGIVSGPQFFNIFDFKLVDGSPHEVLAKKRSIVLSKSLSDKFFGYEDPIGKEVELDYYGRFTVTGILEDVPANSYIQFNFIITQDYDVFFENVASWFPSWFQSWRGDPTATYVLLDKPSSKTAFESQISKVLTQHIGPDVEINKHYLLGMEDLHFNSHGIDGRINEYVKGDLRKVKFLIGIAIIILTMACLNYINISTSRYLKRTKEVGIRKAMGAYSNQVTYQFLIESFLMVLISFMVGIVLVYFFLPDLNSLTGIQLGLNPSSLIEVAPYFLATILLVTFLAGFYPAFHLSRFSAIRVLKNLTVSVKGTGLVRGSLVTVQFSFVIVILVILAVVNRQYSYMSDRSLGFNSEDLLVVEVNGAGVRNNFPLLKNELLALPEVASVAGLTRMISGYRSPSPVTVNATESPDETHPMRFYGMDSDGVSTLKLDVRFGENFSGSSSLDSMSVLLNETAVEVFGNNQIVGQFIEVLGEEGDILRAKVVGVVNDFHHQSLHGSIGPVVIGYYKNPIVSLDDIVIKLSGESTIAALEKIEKIHNRYDTNDVMTWEFMDDMLQRAYEQEQIFRNIFITASALSFCIALIGMIGLTAYSVTAKTKEIGIRKILGASFFSILNMESKELTKYLAASAVISIPLSWWLANSWLLNFEYRIAVSPFIFLGVILLILLATFIVVFLVGRKVARSPVVEAIRYE